MIPRVPSANDRLRSGKPNHRESLRADSLIFDRIRCFPTLVCDRLCKNFHGAGVRASSVVYAKRSDQYVQILFRKCAESRVAAVTKILISSYFLQL
jgi:hypothetical protein